MKTKDEIINNADVLSLQIKEVTHARNDYPQNLGDIFIIGFETFEEAQNFCDENGGEIGIGDIKNGGHFYHYRGRTYEPFTVSDYLIKLGDNYNETNKQSEIDYLKSLLVEASENFEGNIDTVIEMLQNKQEVFNELADAEADETVIVGYGVYSETVKNSFMQFSEDVTSYAIGVFFDRDNFTDNID